jgi:hypothetical protein
VRAAVERLVRRIGRLGVAAFSDGHGPLIQFMNSHGTAADRNLYLGSLSEIHSFDPPGDLAAGAASVAARWRKAKATDPNSGSQKLSDRLLRLYWNGAKGVSVAGGSWAQGGGEDFTEDGASGHSLVMADLNGTLWQALGKRLSPSQSLTDVHHLIPATMMTHAARVSRFPVFP